MLATKRFAGVAPEVNLKDHTSYTPPASANKVAHSGLETQRRCHQKLKTGYRWPHKRTRVYQKFKKKSTTKFHTAEAIQSGKAPQKDKNRNMKYHKTSTSYSIPVLFTGVSPLWSALTPYVQLRSAWPSSSTQCTLICTWSYSCWGSSPPSWRSLTAHSTQWCTGCAWKPSNPLINTCWGVILPRLWRTVLLPQFQPKQTKWVVLGLFKFAQVFAKWTSLNSGHEF